MTMQHQPIITISSGRAFRRVARSTPAGLFVHKGIRDHLKVVGDADEMFEPVEQGDWLFAPADFEAKGDMGMPADIDGADIEIAFRPEFTFVHGCPPVDLAAGRVTDGGTVSSGPAKRAAPTIWGV